MVRMTVLAVEGGQGETVVEIKEYRSGSLPGCYYKVIPVTTEKPKRVSATKFISRNNYSGRPSLLKIFLDDKDTGKYLSPSHLVNYTKIIFTVVVQEDDMRTVRIHGVPARWFDVPRLYGLGFLGGDFQGRPMELLA